MSEDVVRNPRESMAILPDVVQPFLTWLTGMPLAGQSPMFLWSPWSLVACCAGEILAGLTIGILALHTPHWPSLFLLPVSWILTTGGVRTFYVVIAHCCTHHIFSSKKITNRITAEIISILFWTPAYNDFKVEHAAHHRITRLPEDPDTRFLNEWGLYAGMRPDAIVRQLIKLALSPAYHIKSFAERIHSSFSGSANKTLLAVAYMCALFYVLTVLHIWIDWLVLWVFPLVFLFQVSMVINILTEHRWPSRDNDGQRDLAAVCFGRFCGEDVPSTDGLMFAQKLRLWAVWWVRVAFVYLPYRLFVLVGDEPQHDLHHRQPASDWANAKFARFEQVSSGNADKYGHYTDEWGSLLDHIHACANARRPERLAPVPSNRSFEAPQKVDDVLNKEPQI
jgi:hypothetical protein